MTEQEARLILQSYQPELDDPNDPEVANALRLAAENPQFARWWDEEQAFDQAMAAQIAALAAPFGLKTRILAKTTAPATSPIARWIVGLAGAAALLFLLTQVADIWRHASPAAGAAALPAYASEMVSFVKVPPSLEMMSGNLDAVEGWLKQKEAIPPSVPPNLAALGPVGCRLLSFREHDVTLICFKRNGGKLAHLFVVDRAALPNLKPGGTAVFQQEGDWMTATWMEKDRIYMIALQGDKAAVQSFLPSA
ncbi:MAG TPA: hypothetical protein VGF73_02250 [Chthoniobacterales bacterium]